MSPPRARCAWVLPLLVVLAGCGGGGGGGGSANPPPSSVNPNVGLAAIERFDRLAELPRGARLVHVGGHDLTGGNDDGFNGYNPETGNRAFLYYDGSEFVVLDVEGAGVLHRMNFAYLCGATSPPVWCPPGGGADDYFLRFYFDGEAAPRIEATMAQLTSGSFPGFPAPLVGGELASSGGPFSYLPLPFEQGLRIGATGLPHFFNFDVQIFPTAAGVKTWEASDDPSEAVEVFGLAGSDPKPGSENDLSIAGSTTVLPGGSATLASLALEGWITAILVRPLDGLPDTTLSGLRLRIAYDGESEPRVDAPVGLLFGTGFAPATVECLGFGRLSDGTGYLYFPMPFHASAEVSLAYEGPGAGVPVNYEVRWRPEPYGAAFGYFGASHVSVPARVDGQDVTLFQRSGRGKLVGVVVDLTTPDPPFGRTLLEGDERIFVDGLRTPVVHGTATETFFNWGWYEGPIEGPFGQPTHGYAHHQVIGAVDETSCHRLMFGDAIPFDASIEFGFEHGGANTNDGGYDAVVFHYVSDAPGLIETDAFDPGDPSSEAAHGYARVPDGPLESQTSAFEGREATAVSDDGYEIGAQSAFTASILPNNAGVRIARLHDQGAGRQRAIVRVDGVIAGVWYQSRTNPFSRWFEEGFEIPPALTAGKSSIQVSIEPTGAGTTWNEYHYRVFSRVAP